MGKSLGATILVTDADRGSAISIIRSLGRQGRWRVIAADQSADSLGFKSRYADDWVVYPDPVNLPREFVQSMFETVRMHDVDLIIPVTDDVILPLANARYWFQGQCEIAMPSANALEMVSDKLKTMMLARSVGVPTPETYLVYSVMEAANLAPRLEFPVVLKPQYSRVFYQNGRTSIRSMSVSYAANANEMIEQIAVMHGTCGVLVQEYSQGTGFGVELLAYKGHPLAAFQHKRLREFPPTGGASSLRVSTRLDPTLYEYSLRLLSALGWTGLAMIEFKVGPQGARLMEINGRVWGSMPLAVHSGMDFPSRLASLYLEDLPGYQSQPDSRYKVGVRSRHLEKDVTWIIAVLAGRKRYPFLKYPRRWRAIPAALSLLNPFTRHDIQSWRDPRPGLAEIPKIIRQLMKKVT